LPRTILRIELASHALLVDFTGQQHILLLEPMKGSAFTHPPTIRAQRDPHKFGETE
jgi:hypothetical protein